MRIRRMPIACWNNYGYKLTLTISNTDCFSTVTMATKTRLNVTSYLHCLFCYALYSLSFLLEDLKCINVYTCFDVLLTVHLSIFISVFNQLDAHNLFHNKFYFMPLHASRTCVRNT